MDLDGGGNFPFNFFVDKQGLEPAYARPRETARLEHWLVPKRAWAIAQPVV